MIIALALTAVAPQFDAGQRDAIGQVVREYLLAHPEVIGEALAAKDARDMARAVATHRQQLETPYGNAWEGAAAPDVIVVQFFDYACGYCRASLPDIDRLLREDPKVRVVYREFPVLSPASEAAARLALAAAKGSSYAKVHRALYASKQLDGRALAALGQQYGVKPATGDATVEGEIKANRSLARPLQLTGTPSWVIGDQVLSGAVGYDSLKAAVSAARARASASGSGSGLAK